MEIILTIIICSLLIIWILTKQICQHKWEEEKTTDHYLVDDLPNGDRFRSYDYTTVRCRCNKCGIYKTFKLKG